MKNFKIIIIAGVAVLAIGVGAVLLGNRQVPQVLSENTQKEMTDFRKALGKDTLVIGIDEAFPPITFKDADGNYTGVDIDFAKEFAKRAGINIDFKPVEWDNIIPALIAKEIDVVWSGMGITAERKERVVFAVNSRSPKGVAFVIADSEIDSKDDLVGKVIAVQSGSYQETDLKNGKIIPTDSWKELKSLSTLPEAILDLQLGRIDAVICSQDSAGYYIEKTLNASSKFRIVDVGYAMGAGGVAFRKEDDAVKVEAQKIIDEMIADGTASSITMKWLGVDKYKDWDFNYSGI